MNTTLKTTISEVLSVSLNEERMAVVQPLIDYIIDCEKSKQSIDLNFICTHNSRRSQLAQLWAKTAADYFDIPINAYSGGVEVTAFNERAIESIGRFGFQIDVLRPGENPLYSIVGDEAKPPVEMFSKVFDDKANNSNHFAAIMTCAHADDNCPHIPNAKKRIAVRYEDPKAFDDSPLEEKMYDERSFQIASEMFYVFKEVKAAVNV